MTEHNNDEAALLIQINGKYADIIKVQNGLNDLLVEELVLQNDDIIDIIGNRVVRKVIIIPDKIVNLIVE